MFVVVNSLVPLAGWVYGKLPMRSGSARPALFRPGWLRTMQLAGQGARNYWGGTMVLRGMEWWGVP